MRLIKPEYLDFTGTPVQTGDFIIFSDRIQNGGLNAGKVLKPVLVRRRTGKGLKILRPSWEIIRGRAPSNTSADCKIDELDWRNACLIVDHKKIPFDQLCVLNRVYQEIYDDPKMNQKYIEL